ncbi:MAG: HEAT repeat domain-containing protein, partial [Planctomycetes bacterium]|nr:HEAT repeat domain-containing protein [Planctomycetota bacterium]
MTLYTWKRFWCPRDEEFQLADDGYLYDPDGQFGKQVNPHLAPLSTFADCPCLVMLGEPGIGKSTEFDAEFSPVNQDAAASGNLAVRIDLKEYQTDSRLVAEAFDNEIIRAWQASQHTLHLFFDSLDEGRLEVSNIATILAGQLRRLAPHADRLRLRIACRTAEWPVSLEQALTDVWGEQVVRVVALTPLRQCDVVAAAETEGIRPGSFLDDISNKDLQPFAINPITLKFLLDIHRQSGELPSTKQQLYEQGCHLLCGESSQTRRDAGHFGSLSPARRLEVAGRIAAISVFSGRSTIETGAQPSPDADLLAVADLAGRTEQFQGNRFDVSESAIREVLATALFSGCGPELLGFTHRTYSEFLAARYVSRRGLDQTQVGSLIFHPECETKVVPQLAETAAWIAIDNGQISERMMCGDPQTLLHSNVATADDSVKATLVARLLDGFQAGELDDSDWSLRDHYRKLKHSGLADQLEPVIRDKTQNVVTRRFVADLAEECRETGLLQALCDVALDQTDSLHIRAQALHAIVKVGDDAASERLRPLALGKAGADPDDELRGSALQAVWPRRLITTEELFASLPPPQSRSFFGAYRYFLDYELTKHLAPDDLEIGLRWCREQPPMRGQIDDLEHAVSGIVQRSLSCLEKPHVLNAFADYVVSRIKQHDKLHLDAETWKSMGVPDRRKIVATVVPKLDDTKGALFALITGSVPLIQGNDLEWLLERSATAESHDEARVWATLARIHFLNGDGSQIDHVLNCCELNLVAAEVFSDLFRPVELDSPTASKLRAAYTEHLELIEESRKRHESPLLDPPPEVRVEACLQRIEAGDLDGWWHLNQELQLEPRSTRYLHDLYDDLTQFPGWIAADDLKRNRILAAAKRYLSEWQSTPDEWVDTRIIHYPDFAGYRALVLVEKLAPTLLQTIDSSRWASIAPPILGFPTNPGLEDEA